MARSPTRASPPRRTPGRRWCRRSWPRCGASRRARTNGRRRPAPAPLGRRDRRRHRPSSPPPHAAPRRAGSPRCAARLTTRMPSGTMTSIAPRYWTTDPFGWHTPEHVGGGDARVVAVRRGERDPGRRRRSDEGLGAHRSGLALDVDVERRSVPLGAHRRVGEPVPLHATGVRDHADVALVVHRLESDAHHPVRIGAAVRACRRSSG